MFEQKFDQKKVKEYHSIIINIKKEVAKIVVGQEEAVNSLILGLLADGHILVEGIPGIAKTLLIRAMAKAVGCEFSRIQFTVDLLPTDITGITTYNPQKGFYVIKGPIFANFVLADEINRAPPKSQSALLEAMQERQATIGTETFPMPKPFFVMATQNPIETSGVYNLPEAQIDRFLFKIYMGYPDLESEKKIVDQNITLRKFEEYDLKPITNSAKIIEMQEFTKNVQLSEELKDYIIEIVNATRHPKDYNISLGKYIQLGASPRASIGLYIAGKAYALMRGDPFVTPQHVKGIAHLVLRHRLILNYEGIADEIKTDTIVSEILSKVPIP